MSFAAPSRQVNNKYKALLLTLISILMIGCQNSKDSAPATKDEITALKVFFEETGAVETPNNIKIFNAKSETSKDRADYDKGNNKLFTLDTDEDKPGFEYIAFVNTENAGGTNQNSRIRVMNAETGQSETVAQFRATICGIFPDNTFADSTFAAGSAQLERILQNKSILVTTPRFQTCDDEQLFYETSFDLDENNFSTREINSARFIGSLVVDADFQESNRNSFFFTDGGRVGFLGYDQHGQQVVLRDDSDFILWETQLLMGNKTPLIQQVSDVRVALYNDSSLFLLNTDGENENLFELGRNETTDQVPSKSRVDNVFVASREDAEFTPRPEGDEIRFRSNDELLIVEDANGIYFKTLNNAEDKQLIDTKNAPSEALEFDITDNNVVFVLRNVGVNTQSLVRYAISDSMDVSEPMTLAQAEQIEFYVNGEEIFINTLNRGSTEGWEAHYARNRNNELELFTYADSRVLMLQDKRTETQKPLILGSEATTADGSMQQPSLYEFDASEADENGLRLKRKDGVVVQESGVAVPFTYGQLLTDLNIEGPHGTQNWIVHNEFGSVQLTTQDGDNTYAEIYYFDPVQKDSDDPTLVRLSREIRLDDSAD